MDVKTQIEQVAFNSFVHAMKLSPRVDGSFKLEMDYAIGDVTLPLLIVGVTHKDYGDGRCFALLNPSKALQESTGSESYFKKIDVRGKCDIMSCQWINTNGVRPEVTNGFSYVSRRRMKQAPYVNVAGHA